MSFSGRRIPKFGAKDEEYKMDGVSTTPETARIREHMQISLDFIAYLQENGWLSDDSEGAQQLSDAWMTVWNEYATIREAIDGQGIKRDLFGKYLPGDMINSAHDLVVGDCVRDHIMNNNHIVIYKSFTEIQWKNENTGVLSDVVDLTFDHPVEYLGRDLWTP